MKTELELLKEKILLLERKQMMCTHDWNNTIYEPERVEIKEEKFVPMGSDSYYTLVGTGIYEKKDRWSRTCKICEKKEYAYEQEEVAVKTIKKPKFR